MTPVGDDVEVTPTLRIPRRELTWSVGTASGPGGQHVNRTYTRVEVRFDVAGSPSLTDAQRTRLLDRLGPEVRVRSDARRSQAANREAALARLAERLAAALYVQTPRRPTRPSRASAERRLESKGRQAQRKRDRRPPDDT